MIVQTAIFLFLLAGCMAVQHLIMTGNDLKFLDNTFGIKWFGIDAWRNKNTWCIKMFGNEYYVFRWPVLIMLTDAFHMAHGIMGLAIGSYCALASFTDERLIAGFSVIFAIVYSLGFDIIYTKWHNKHHV